MQNNSAPRGAGSKQQVVLMNRPCNYMVAAAGVLIKIVQINASPLRPLHSNLDSQPLAAELTPHTRLTKKCAANKKLLAAS
jgi:hypothetical protein